jgi:UDP-N-acetylglucosamine diphosphorylase / glucose-1-phosphate thymidylyltransferase / UDP-N-acetylgalactosamine diphosphorylase / glucosamine-1-phosphate N-acetyltransferase / galactosamine-1-phosphate N-acetyltransferase
MEKELDEWLLRFAGLEELFSSRNQLYSKLSRQQLDGIIEENVTIVGPVYMGPNTLVKSGAILKGPLIVGPNSIIDNGANVLSRTFLGAGTYVSSGAVVFDSVLMNDCLVSENCVIQNSILGCGVVVKAGCLIGDRVSTTEQKGTYVGDEAELGLGSILCAGSVIPQHQRVLPGAVVVA